MTNQNGFWRFNHNQVFDPTKRNEAAIGDGNIVICTMLNDCSPCAVAMGVGRKVRWQGRLCANIIPIKIGDYRRDIAGIFHDGVIDGNFRQAGEAL